MLSPDLMLDLLSIVEGRWFLCRVEEAEGWEEDKGLNEYPSFICLQLGNLRKMVSSDLCTFPSPQKAVEHQLSPLQVYKPA